MQYQFLLLLASIGSVFAVPILHSGNGSGYGGTPGRVLTKTYTYDSTKDLDDPCNPVNGDPKRCLLSMENNAPSPNAPSPERFYVADELDAAQVTATGTDFDTVYERRPKKILASDH